METTSSKSKRHQQMFKIQMFMYRNGKLHDDAPWWLASINDSRQDGGKNSMWPLNQNDMCGCLCIRVDRRGCHHLKRQLCSGIHKISPNVPKLSFPLGKIFVEASGSWKLTHPIELIVVIDEPRLHSSRCNFIVPTKGRPEPVLV